ncbi:hypothetical protein BDV34DRAFT_188564 [Aspergillus parasiticus]|uniref:Uncharacterized protein n=1 Tax=Aspergillus parasiticus TaxID=5067 RepID=A0A5N6DWD9_ASPPA|nr:hypothetical protein BDV34DRAFT_188564 [Aspergillus parasiticus]
MVPYHAHPRPPLLKISGIAVGGWHHCRHSRSPRTERFLLFFSLLAAGLTILIDINGAHY